MKQKKIDKTLYAFWANGYGPRKKEPVKVEWTDLDCWYDSSGDNCIDCTGLDIVGPILTFAHKDKKEVERFIEGFEAARSILQAGFFKP